MLQAIPPRLAAVGLVAVGLTLAGCKPKPEAPPSAAPPINAAPPTAPLTPPTVSRADLLQAIALARAAYAAGQAEGGESLSGRRFAVRQAFGCSGPADSLDEGGQEGMARWAWGDDRSRLDIRLTPADWTTAPVLIGDQAAPQAPWEAVEGFWLARPWLTADGCPAPPITPPAPDGEVTPAAVATPPTAGLAAVFPAGGSRVGRRDGRAYAFTLRGEPTPEPPVGGYRLLIEGRFTAFPDGRAIRCRAPGPDAEPVCVAAAEVDRVAFEDATGRLLREWRRG